MSKIVFARFLELPLGVLDRQVAALEKSPAYAALAPWTRAGSLTGAYLADTAGHEPPADLESVLGEVDIVQGHPRFRYRRAGFVREYRFDETALGARKPALSGKAQTLLCRMKLVNSRNRLTHALIGELMEVQRRFVLTGDPRHLVPIPQAEMSRRLNAKAGLSMVADASRLSRLIRNLDFRMPGGEVLPIKTLLPRQHQLLCQWVSLLIRSEKNRLLEGEIPAPMPDEAIAEHLADRYGVRLTRRAVAAVRYQLAIPNWRQRSASKDYLAATEEFSPLLPLTPQALSSHVPAHPGVYEIRATSAGASAGESPASMPTTVLYIGSTGDLRKRLADHRRGNNGNPKLTRFLAGGGIRIRYRVVAEGWRLVEKELYRVFCETFGVPPPCNRMSP